MRDIIKFQAMMYSAGIEIWWSSKHKEKKWKQFLKSTIQLNDVWGFNIDYGVFQADPDMVQEMICRWLMERPIRAVVITFVHYIQS